MHNPRDDPMCVRQSAQNRLFTSPVCAFASLLETIGKPLQQTDPDLVLADGVLNPVLEIGIVVDFHHDDAAVSLLEIDAVEALADRARRAYRDVDHFGRRLIELERAEA